MQFTFDAYKRLINSLRIKDYEIRQYDSWKQSERCVILRHDIDYDLDKAVSFAEFEENLGIRSTYFVLLSSELYNVFSANGKKALKRILEHGHSIGLHFDETCYGEKGHDIDLLREKIRWEASLLSEALQSEVKTVSMHRPGKVILDSDFSVPEIINCNSIEYLNGTFKYLSDSRRRWREPVEEIVESGEYDKLHILTHAFWYNEDEVPMNAVVKAFIRSANADRYDIFNDNFTNLFEVMKREEA